MDKILHEFINSDLTEANFFDLPKEDLITLKEYFLSMREKDKEFKELIKEPLESMKDKCGWINTIGYRLFQQSSTHEYINSAIYLFPVLGNCNTVSKNNASKEFRDLIEKVPKIYLLNKDIRMNYQRHKEIPFIQDELEEIDRIGQSFYDGLLIPKKTVSDKFQVSYIPNAMMSLYDPEAEEILAYYNIRNLKLYDKPILNEEQKQKVLTKIQLRK